MATIEELKDRVRQYYPEADLTLLEKAYALAEEAHGGQKRMSGEEYISHPLEVAMILAELQLDDITLAAAILHDVVEDTAYSLEDIEQEFGPEITLLVDGVTKLSRIEYKSKEEQQVDNLRKMFIAMAKDIRVILIKLADRLHNMRTLKYHSPQKQKEIAAETLDIFAPLAHRLGIFQLKWQLEDLALRYLNPEGYYDLVQKISMRRQERETYLAEVIKELKLRLTELNLKADIQGRPKHFYSIYNKMVNKGKELSEIYDLIAVRVVVDTVPDCYAVLGVIHTMWKPIPGRFKDYIAMPKPNMYQSLHTTVIGPQGEPFEVQIRTWDMHRTAEFGIAAHWLYKEGKQKGDENFDTKLAWLRQVLQWQQDTRDPGEFMDSLRIDLFSDRVYVFTPKGDIVELPSGSVPIDFAYKVHTDVGHRCVGARVNHKMVPLDYRLKTGDIVEIITQKGSRPSRDWLNLVASSQAKNKIRTWFRKERKEENEVRGRELLEKECRKLGLAAEEVLKSAYLDRAGHKFSINSVSDLYVAVAEGVVTPGQVLGKVKEQLNQEQEREFKPVVKPWTGYGKAIQGVRVKGVDNVMVRLGHCCNPLPGDEIVGYITRGRGVSVHRVDCPNVVHHKEVEQERIIEVAWDLEAEANFQVHLEVAALDRANLAMDIMSAVQDTKTIINSVHARALKNNQACVDLKLEIRSLEHLQYIMDKIKKIKDVQELHRVIPH